TSLRKGRRRNLGRKVHPVGFRLKTIRDWNTRWYAEGERYRDLLQEDFAIRRQVHRELPQAGISRIEIERFPNQVQVNIWTAKPGIVIGRKGGTVKDLRTNLRKLTGKTVKVEVEEITQPDLDAKLVAENIAGQLERRISHSRAMKRAMMQAMRQGAPGIRIKVTGRLGGSEMKSTGGEREERGALQTTSSGNEQGTAEHKPTHGKCT